MHTTSATLLVINEDTAADEDSLISGCTFEIDASAPLAYNILPCNSHNNVSGYFGTVTFASCIFNNFIAAGTMFAMNHTADIVMTNPVFNNCKYGFSFPVPANVKVGCTATVTGGTWSSNVAGQRAVNYSLAMIDFELSEFTFTFLNNTDTGHIYLGAAATVNVHDCTLNQNYNGAGARQAVWCSSAGADLTLQYNVYTGLYNWATNIYQFTAGAAGMTWASDYNTFGPNFQMNIFGTPYSDLGAYQAATSQDLNSSLG
jgi:hypothetical protein